LGSGRKLISAPGKSSRVRARSSPAEGLKLVTLYVCAVSDPRGAACSRVSASMASGMAMNGIRVSSRTKHA
jgi:hypothetical protein